jgi:DNA replication and repair protein RecF
VALVPFYIPQIKLTNFKNYGFSTFNFSEKLNFIVGNNGWGKTNLLDAAYYSCFTKSYLTSADALLPSFETNFFRIETNITLNSDNHLIEIKYLKLEKKEVFLDRVKIEKQADYIGRFPCVIIVPDDNQLILGGSDTRRRFLDATLSQFSPKYFSSLITYNKILGQRNALLKLFFENRSFDKNLLEVYNNALMPAAKTIFEYRKKFMDAFIPIFNRIYKQIFDGNENIEITYESDLSNGDYEEIIAGNEQRDRASQRTTMGIHTDDLVFQLNGYPLKKTGSQGQQKTFLLSLKLAQYELLKQKKQIAPLLLLDDIFDKLDGNRVGQLFELIHGDAFGQVFITDTNCEEIKSLIGKHGITNYKMIELGKL